MELKLTRSADCPMKVFFNYTSFASLNIHNDLVDALNFAYAHISVGVNAKARATNLYQ
jgi:hypothetical protein